MSEEQVIGTVESSTVTEAPTTTGTSGDGQNADGSTESPPAVVTPVTTKTPESGQSGNASTQYSGAPKVVLKDRTFLDRILDGMFPSSLQRLRNTLPGFREELNALERKVPDPPGGGWKESANDLLVHAVNAANARDAEKGWQCLNAASRFMLYGLDKLPASTSTGTNKDRPLLIAQATSIRNTASDEGKGLPEWRRTTIKDLLNDKEGKLKDPVNVDEVVEAKRILDEHNDNLYRRLAILKSRLLLLTIAGIAFLVVWLFFLQPPVPAIVVSSSVSKATPSAGTNDATSGEANTTSASPAATVASGDSSSSPAATSASGEASAPSASPAPTKAAAGASTPAASPAATKVAAGDSDQQASTRSVADTFWWMVVLAGLLGGLISASTSAIRSDIRKSNIPAELSTQTVTFARLMLAALSALAITLFLTSGLLSFEQLSYELILAIAIVSGFTDRLLLRAVDQVAKTA